MRLILDTNQASKLTRLDQDACERLRQRPIVLSPAVWAEVMLHPKGRTMLGSMSNLCLRFGEDPITALRSVASATDAQARFYDPLVRAKSLFHRKMRRMCRNMPPEARDTALRVKNDNLRQMSKIDHEFRLGTKKFRDARSRGEAPTPLKGIITVEEAFDKMDAPDFLLPALRADGEPLEELSSKPNTVARRLMSNPYTCRFLQIFVTAHVAYGDGWANGLLNVTASENRDDITDMTLALYAKDGDIILTEDKMFRRWYRHIDPKGTVRTMTYAECFTT